MSDPQENIIGIHAVAELLKQSPESVISLVFQSGRDDPRLAELRALAQQHNIESEDMDKRSMDKKFDGVHQGAVAISRAESRTLSEKELISLLDKLDHDPLLLILDGVTDPHNLGACLRTADAAGVDAVIIPKDKSAGLTPTVRKVACGAAETVNLVSVTNLARCLQTLKDRGVWIMGATDQAFGTIYQQELTGAIAVVMVSEGSGIRRLTQDKCDFLVSIPMAGQLSSLNVSVATGVCLYEAARQRRFADS